MALNIERSAAVGGGKDASRTVKSNIGLVSASRCFT